MEKPSDLETRGSALWDAVTTDYEFDNAGYALLEDICHTADNIARLQKTLDAPHHEWVELVDEHGNEGRVTVVVTNVLETIRRQRLAMRQMMQHLRIGAPSGNTAPDPEQKFWADLEKMAQT